MTRSSARDPGEGGEGATAAGGSAANRSAAEGAVHALVADLFRRSSSRLVASLTRALGAENLHLAEECVQDALVRALQTWPFRGIPDEPEAWLFTAARNRALDRVRRRSRWEVDVPLGRARLLGRALEELPAPAHPGTAAADALADDELALVLMCCHPALSSSPDARVALTLKVACGLSVKEIAAAFLVEPATVAQRIVRAKRTLRRSRARFEIPGPADLPARMDAVLRVLYLMFNEGYAAWEDDRVVRRELCDEALRLGRLLASHPATSGTAVDALVALMLLQSSRLPARTGVDGGILVLEEQDRSLWDRHRIQEGMVWLDRAGRGDTLTPYHLEAGIAAVHAVSPSFERTDWRRILSYYDVLRDVTPSPVVEVNRAVAVAMVDGPDAGVAALDAVAESGELARYHLLPAVRGMLLARAGRHHEAAVQLRRAFMAAPSRAARRFLEEKIAELPAEP